MKISEVFRMTPKQHAELAYAMMVKAKIKTVGQLKEKVKKSTLPQRDVDAILDFIQGVPSTKQLLRRDVEQIAAGANVDLRELLDLIEME